MGIGVEHDDRERKDVGRVGVGKLGRHVSSNVPFGKLENVSVDLLGLSWQSERLEERPERIDKFHVAEVKHVDKTMHDSNVFLLSTSLHPQMYNQFVNFPKHRSRNKINKLTLHPYILQSSLCLIHQHEEGTEQCPEGLNFE